ncbi:SHOCT domain-containing protein [Nocardiopsis eucommiae]|uniref:SHOCT domain-containing protein n=1 Tax=Nocardiopsis eucommiae TaxID=2831970 RepID=A0A975QJF8_9ACTN|nr:SHOCT domain-containing protein [Nocardiopsis eucommiae]
MSGGRELEQAILDPEGGPVKTWLDKAEENSPQGADHPLVVKPLATLSGLLDSGEITQEEHDERRAKILAKLSELG